MDQAKEHTSFITVTCLEWKHILSNDAVKNIVIESLSFLTRRRKINVFGFCIMSNHLHLIWQMVGDYRPSNVRRDFLKYTSQRILAALRENPLRDELLVNAKDGRYQVWERNALSIPIYSENVFFQKLGYIHNNPVVAGLCVNPEDYYYSSAGFYFKQVNNFDFLCHYDG